LVELATAPTTPGPHLPLPTSRPPPISAVAVLPGLRPSPTSRVADAAVRGLRPVGVMTLVDVVDRVYEPS
ncbi:hypothetical protein ACWEK5_33090, partial [Rhodococcus koreensis]